MTFNLLLRNSLTWTSVFLVLVALAMFTQHSRAKSVPYVVRGLVKAAPALFLAGLSWYWDGPPLLTLAFFLCACGDVLLEIARTTFPPAFEVGAAVFGLALICLSIAYLNRPVDGWPLLPLTLPNLVVSVFVCVWVLPKIRRSLRVPAVAYLGLLLISNVVASTSLVPVFLGSTLWLLSDLAIGVGRHISATPSNGMTNLGVYEVGLYFIAIGFLSS